MALTETSEIDLISVVSNGTILVRYLTGYRDGAEISRVFHRRSFAPGAELTVTDPQVLAVAATVWTPEVVAAYEALLAAGPL